MNLSNITDRAKALVKRRGGTEALKQDAQELRDIAKGEGSLTDKAKLAAEAVKAPGAAGTSAFAGTAAEPSESEATAPASVDPGPSGAGEPGAGEPSGNRPDGDSRPA